MSEYYLDDHFPKNVIFIKHITDGFDLFKVLYDPVEWYFIINGYNHTLTLMYVTDSNGDQLKKLPDNLSFLKDKLQTSHKYYDPYFVILDRCNIFCESPIQKIKMFFEKHYKNIIYI